MNKFYSHYSQLPSLIYHTLQPIIYQYIITFFTMFVIDAFITLSPLIGLYAQYSLMKQTKNVGSFSIDTCAIAIFANIIRICFWFAQGFANNLLLQSILVIGFQLIVLHLCIRLGYKKTDEEGLWRWNDFQSFVMCIAAFSLIAAMVTAVFIWMDIKMYGTVAGLIALSIEAIGGVPQFISNQKNRSVEGLSVFMVITWFFCDFTKTLYFVVQNQPFQFILSGAFQLTMDVLIIIQIMAFQERNSLLVKSSQEGYQPPVVEEEISH